MRNYNDDVRFRVLNHKIKGETALIYASKWGHKNTARALLKRGADPNIEDNINKRTPLIWATINKYRKVNKVLFEFGAVVDYKDINGRTALFYACLLYTSPSPRD